MTKRFSILIIVLLHIAIVGVLSAPADNMSECVKVFESNCAECHDIDRGCELLGQPEKEWKALFDFMEEMGADLPDDEKNLLINCLSQPDEAVKKTCQN